MKSSSVKSLIAKLMLAAMLMIGLNQNINAQPHQNFQVSINEYLLQVRVNPANKWAAHVRGPIVSVDRLSYYMIEFDSEQEALDWAADNTDHLLLGVYPSDPEPTPWRTVQIESSYADALDAWYEIVGNTDGLEVQIKSRPRQLNLAASIGGSMFDYNNSSTSTSLLDYYYDYKITVRLNRVTNGYLIQSNSRANSVFVRTFRSQYDFQNYMAANPAYELLDMEDYWPRSIYTMERFHVRTASTMEEALEIMEFIEQENPFNSLVVSFEYVWNP